MHCNEMTPADRPIAALPDEREPAQIRLLNRHDIAGFRMLRLAMLADAPSAFGASPDDEAVLNEDAWAARIGPDDNTAMFGAFAGQRLVGSVGLVRQRPAKMRHKALIWGVFVDPTARGQSLARRLMQTMIAHARALPQVRQVSLSVTSSNAHARALYESLGFVQYGHEPDALYVDGEWFDEQQMVLRFTSAA